MQTRAPTNNMSPNSRRGIEETSTELGPSYLIKAKDRPEGKGPVAILYTYLVAHNALCATRHVLKGLQS